MYKVGDKFISMKKFKLTDTHGQMFEYKRGDEFILMSNNDHDHDLRFNTKDSVFHWYISPYDLEEYLVNKKEYERKLRTEKLQKLDENLKFRKI